MHLIDFINENVNWREQLTQPPYSFNLIDDYPYTLIKYQFGITDFSHCGLMGLEARGLIVKKEDNTYRAVSHGLNKFFNIEEPEASSLDWKNNIVVQEKIDGTNIRLWWDDGKWHISTLGVINAEHNLYGELFKKACGNFNLYTKNLNPHYTYVYEVVSPQNHIVVHYGETQAYFICARDNITGKEMTHYPKVLGFGIQPIPQYPITTIQDVENLRNNLGEEHEGLVVMDSHFNRVKLKTQWYLELHTLKGNGVCNVKRVVRLWQSGILDDFIATFPEYTTFIQSIMQLIQKLINTSNTLFQYLMPLNLERKDFAAKLQYYTPLIKDCCFVLLDGKCTNAYEYFVTMRPNGLIRYLEEHLSETEFVGNVDDN